MNLVMMANNRIIMKEWKGLKWAAYFGFFIGVIAGYEIALLILISLQ